MGQCDALKQTVNLVDTTRRRIHTVPETPCVVCLQPHQRKPPKNPYRFVKLFFATWRWRRHASCIVIREPMVRDTRTLPRGYCNRGKLGSARQDKPFQISQNAARLPLRHRGDIGLVSTVWPRRVSVFAAKNRLHSVTGCAAMCKQRIALTLSLRMHAESVNGSISRRHPPNHATSEKSECSLDMLR